MKVNLRINTIEVVDNCILIKEVSLLDKNGYVLRKASINNALCAAIVKKIEESNTIELTPDSRIIYDKLKEKNPLIEKLFETLDLKIINE